jgi:voltage-gated potassium channel
MKNKIWQLVILVLSLYVVVELSIEIICPLSKETIELINLIDLFICTIFMGDFFYFLFKAENKWHYLRYHWIDFVASIPFMTFFRVFRLVRVIRIIRLLRGVKGLVNIFRMLGTSKLQNILISYIIIMVLVMGYCSLAFFEFEKGTNPNVKNYFDAFWWAFVSLTSIGYGDVIPTTTEGRIVGMVLALAGMGLFSVITAQLATTFFHIKKEEEKEIHSTEETITPEISDRDRL